ncbi:MAG: nucleotide-binding protein [Paracoccaceae bacterium]
MSFELEFDNRETIDKLSNFLDRANKIAPSGEGFHFRTWFNDVHTFLKEAFTDNAIADNFETESDMQISYSYIGEPDAVDGYDIAKARKALRRYIRGISETVGTAPTQTSPKALKNSDRVFIVHGHDEKHLLEVKEILKSQGLTPVVLKDEPNGGATIIEKFEKNSDVGFAIVLFTADDVGAAKSASDLLKPRSRQNVVLELGYFIGKLTRARICALNDHGVELPSDFHGIVYTELDRGGAWRYKLLDELKHAGYTVDKNKL